MSENGRASLLAEGSEYRRSLLAEGTEVSQWLLGGQNPRPSRRSEAPRPSLLDGIKNGLQRGIDPWFADPAGIPLESDTQLEEGESAESAESAQEDSGVDTHDDSLSPAASGNTGGYGEHANGAQAAGNAPSVLEAASVANLATTVKRFSADITTGIANITQDFLKKGNEEEEHFEDDGHLSASSSSEHPPRAPVQAAPTVDIELLMDEARKPFRQLLLETPDAGNVVDSAAARSGSSARDASPASRATSPPTTRAVSPAVGTTPTTNTPRGGPSSGRNSADGTVERSSVGSGAGTERSSGEARPTLHVAIARTRLIGHVVGCCQALAEDLLPDEVQLWNSFVRADTTLHGVLYTSDGGKQVRAVLTDLANSPEQVEAWTVDLTERTNGDGEIDFADLLDWFDECKRSNSSRRWSIQNLRTGISQLLAGGAAGPPRLDPDVLQLIRSRLARASTGGLGVAATSYQRSLVLTSCWKCEQNLEHALGGRGATPAVVPALLSILRAVNGELAPSERVLWELVGTRNAEFDGGYTKADVLAAVGELFEHALARETGTTQPEFEELHRLRVHCQKQSIANLFADERETVTLADMIMWWWDMPDDYRVAAGLVVPSELLRRSLTRQPEEMFRAQLPKAAANPAFARVAVRGHVRIFAELRCLALRRILEGFHGRSPTETRTTCTSVTAGEEDDDARSLPD